MAGQDEFEINREQTNRRGPTCGRCRFWQVQERGDQGECRRWPPVVSPEADGQNSPIAGLWPGTWAWGWCGEYEPRAAGGS